MRSFLAGLILLLLSSGALGQVVGEVESVGFSNSYRPDCWTPMVVRLKPQTNEPANYLLQVWQYDVDGDRPIYTRPITLNGANTASEQRFWMYFLPQPIGKGLPDPSNGGTLKDLQRDLQVFICTPSGKQIAQLPITSTLANIDPYRDFSQPSRGKKLILAVTDGASQPVWRDYQFAIGIMEDVEFVTLAPKDLPEDPIGYEAVDSIVWFESDPADLDKGGQHKLAALQDYVRFGGQLIICQPTTEWQKTAGFGELLPVVLQGVDNKNDLEPLRSMSLPREQDPVRQSVDAWNRPVGPFQFARALPGPSAVVEKWIDWKGDGSYTDATPYLVRKSIGLGQVTWVAQNLGNPAISVKATTGWPYIWDKIFGWNNDTYVVPPNVSKDDPLVRPRLDVYSPGNPVLLGAALIKGMSSATRATWLIFVAVTFFIVYWVIAGPGGYFYLSAHKRASFNWFFFAATALAATFLTVLVVKLVLRGPPEIHHLSFVRVAPDQPALVYSRFGLYIPRDGDQSIQLDESTHEGVSYVSGFAEHPQLLGDATEFPAPADYQVPVRDLDSTDPPMLTVPYRSSSKTFQSKWIGNLTGRFAGKVKLDPENSRLGISGSLTNETGQDFENIYLAFHAKEEDRVIYIPRWAKNSTISLKDLGPPVSVGHIGNLNLAALPGDGKVISDQIGSATTKSGDSRDLHWIGYWYDKFFHGSTFSADMPTDEHFSYVFPLLSFFDRLPPSWNRPADPTKPQSNGSSDRFELYRHGGRMLNVSQSMMAGRLVILASNANPLPVPMEVDGTKIGGAGTVLYQFLVPMDRGDTDKPVKTPTTGPS